MRVGRTLSSPVGCRPSPSPFGKEVCGASGAGTVYAAASFAAIGVSAVACADSSFLSLSGSCLLLLLGACGGGRAVCGVGGVGICLVTSFGAAEACCGRAAEGGGELWLAVIVSVLGLVACMGSVASWWSLIVMCLLGSGAFSWTCCVTSKVRFGAGWFCSGTKSSSCVAAAAAAPCGG